MLPLLLTNIHMIRNLAHFAVMEIDDKGGKAMSLSPILPEPRALLFSVWGLGAPDPGAQVCKEASIS